ncbi:MAG: hypothetical protein HKN73_09940 [Gemmatimonadetes bacterium]|nr:hypothetical protein [Gemmatimonadota bacterium]
MSWIARLRQRLGKATLQEADLSALSCEEVTTFLLDYVDDALEDDMRRRIDEHVGTCSCACERALLAELAFTDRVKGTLRQGRAPEELRRRILEKLSP